MEQAGVKHCQDLVDVFLEEAILTTIKSKMTAIDFHRFKRAVASSMTIGLPSSGASPSLAGEEDSEISQSLTGEEDSEISDVDDLRTICDTYPLIHDCDKDDEDDENFHEIEEEEEDLEDLEVAVTDYDSDMERLLVNMADEYDRDDSILCGTYESFEDFLEDFLFETQPLDALRDFSVDTAAILEDIRNKTWDNHIEPTNRRLLSEVTNEVLAAHNCATDVDTILRMWDQFIHDEEALDELVDDNWEVKEPFKLSGGSFWAAPRKEINSECELFDEIEGLEQRLQEDLLTLEEMKKRAIETGANLTDIHPVCTVTRYEISDERYAGVIDAEGNYIGEYSRRDTVLLDAAADEIDDQIEALMEYFDSRE